MRKHEASSYLREIFLGTFSNIFYFRKLIQNIDGAGG